MKDCFFRRNALSLPEIFSNQFRMKYPIGIQNFEKIREDGYVYVDGVLLEEDYVRGNRVGNFGSYVVQVGVTFLAGDNRLHSGDY